MSVDNNEINEDNGISESNVVSARSALLDFYSDRATTFGGFVLASVFGLVSMLSVAQGINNEDPNYQWLKVFTIIVYVGFALMGRYAFQRFKHYADVADRLQTDMMKHAKLSLITTLKLEKEKKIKIKLDKYLNMEFNEQRKLLVKRLFKIFPFDLLYLGIIILMFLVVYLNDLQMLLNCTNAL